MSSEIQRRTKRKKHYVRWCGAAHRRSVALKASDTYVGIAQENLPLIFELFCHAGSSTTRPYGAGLELYVVKNTASFGANITVESTYGKR